MNIQVLDEMMAATEDNPLATMTTAELLEAGRMLGVNTRLLRRVRATSGKTRAEKKAEKAERKRRSAQRKAGRR